MMRVQKNYKRSPVIHNSDPYAGLQVPKTSWVIVKLNLNLETRKRRGTFHAEGRMCARKGRNGKTNHGLFQSIHQICFPMLKMSLTFLMS